MSEQTTHTISPIVSVQEYRKHTNSILCFAIFWALLRGKGSQGLTRAILRFWAQAGIVLALSSIALDPIRFSASLGTCISAIIALSLHGYAYRSTYTSIHYLMRVRDTHTPCESTVRGHVRTLRVQNFCSKFDVSLFTKPPLKQFDIQAVRFSFGRAEN